MFGRNVSKVDVVFQGRVASKVNNEAHVGNISTDIYNDEMSISKACNEMYAKLNLLYLQFGMCSPDVLYKLFNSYCMSLYTEVSCGIMKTSQEWTLCISLGENVFDVYLTSRVTHTVN